VLPYPLDRLANGPGQYGCWNSAPPKPAIRTRILPNNRRAGHDLQTCTEICLSVGEFGGMGDFEIEGGRQQRLSVGFLGILKDPVGRTLFDNLAVAHHDHVVA
jgi:hypothetical protein